MKTFINFYESMISTSNLFKLKNNIGKEINIARDDIENNMKETEYETVKDNMLRLKKTINDYHKDITNEISNNKKLLGDYIDVKKDVDNALEAFRDPPSNVSQTKLLQNASNSLDKFHIFIQSKLSV